MTREQILQDYEVANGVILSPGKFEGEPIWAPYFYDCYLNGMTDEDDGELMLFHITAEDRAMFPELADTETVSLRQDDNGFVYCADEY